MRRVQFPWFRRSAALDGERGQPVINLRRLIFEDERIDFFPLFLLPLLALVGAR